MKRTTIALLTGTLAASALPASAAIAFAFEFNTPNNDLGWQHNSGNGGAGASGPTTVTVGGTGEGVLTASQLPSNGDLRVLYNPDLVLDTVSFTGWTTIEVRFRQLNGLNGSPEALSGNNSLLFLGTSGTGSSSINGTGFVEESPGSTEFWYTASLDISGMGTNNIGQIRFDPIASTTKDYQVDWVRVNAAPVPEPSSSALLGLGGLALILRRRK
ncbi:MAG: PEP-CTERM sorting domain-containing protein [Akkermansiaceae bacterium]